MEILQTFYLSRNLRFLQLLWGRGPASSQYFVADFSGQHSRQSKGNHPELEKPSGEDEADQEGKTSSFTLPVEYLPREYE